MLYEVVRLPRERVRKFALRVALFVAIALGASAGPAFSGDNLLARPLAIAPLQIPHAYDLKLDWKSRRRSRRADNTEDYDFLDLTPGLEPLAWPRNGDMRARLLTPELRRTPIVGWVAENLYRSRNENGWCLEVDPGEGEYVVSYRRHLR